jgi:hypothetical protein
MTQEEFDKGVVADLARQSQFYDENPRVDAGPDEDNGDDPDPFDYEAGGPTAWVHKYDGEPCQLSRLDHGDSVCIHGYQAVEVYTRPMYPL